MVRTLPFHGKNTGSNPVRDNFLPKILTFMKKITNMKGNNLTNIDFIIPQEYRLLNNTHVNTDRNSELLKNFFGERQVITLGESCDDSVIRDRFNSHYHNFEPVLNEIKLRNSGEVSNALDLSTDYFKILINKPNSFPETTLHMFYGNNFGAYNELFNYVEQAPFKELKNPWPYIQNQVLHLCDQVPSEKSHQVAEQIYMHRCIGAEQGLLNIMDLNNFSCTITGIAESLGNNKNLLTFFEGFFHSSAIRNPAGVSACVFSMFYFLFNNFSDWLAFQHIILIKDNFLIFFKSVMIKLKMSMSKIPQSVATGVWYIHTKFKNINNKTFLSFSINKKFLGYTIVNKTFSGFTLKVLPLINSLDWIISKFFLDSNKIKNFVETDTSSIKNSSKINNNKL